MPIFGGGPQEAKMTSVQVKSTSTSLYDENLKFGAMPTHPLGTSTVFHAGIIGEGKRKSKPISFETEETNR